MSRTGSVHARIARNIRKTAEHSAQRHRSTHLADVISLNPIRAELHDLPHILQEGQDLLLTRWVRSFDKEVGIEKGDNLLVDLRGGVYIAHDVLSIHDYPSPPVVPNSLPPSGPAGGGLAGNYPNPTLAVIPAIKVGRGELQPMPLAATQVQFDYLGPARGGMALSGGAVKVPSAGIYHVSTNILINLSTPSGRIDASVGNLTANTAWKIGGTQPGDGSVSDGGAILAHTVNNFGSLAPSGDVVCSADDLVGVIVYNRTTAAGEIYGAAFWTSMSVHKVSN